ncbi:MAG: hypothetical protein IKY45_00320 [Clostridia bacterium]|nr:hypothetical protein [Clostridia bacterium]MBR4972890.1 hypothetical protein [Clostridia bacterium]
MENDFKRQQQAAVERMRQMNARATQSNYKSQPPKKEQPACEPHIKKPAAKNSFLSGINIPFLDNLSSDGDTALILGLLLILISENTDKTLLFALIYILI